MQAESKGSGGAETVIDQPIGELVSEMSLAEKIGQMTQVSNLSISPDEVTEFAIGSVLSGGDGNPSPNNPTSWLGMVGDFVNASLRTRLAIPLVYGIDAVHGHSSVGGATIFPHNIGLGAVGDPDLVHRIGRATAEEMLATGVQWAFAPTLAVPQDIRWGRTYEGYSDDPELVAELGAALISGLHGPDPDRGIEVMGSAKHFVADGATEWDSTHRPAWNDWWDGWGDTWRIDQGDARISEEELRSVHLPPYQAAIEAGVTSVMASYSSWNGTKLHAHFDLLTGVLKDEMGFEGFVVSDWMGIDQLAPAYEDCVSTAINSGIDMVMVPDDYRRFIETMEAVVADGRIPLKRVDDAVSRILAAKQKLRRHSLDGLPPLSEIGSKPHRLLAAEAVRRSAVLLKGAGPPLLTGQLDSILVAGEAADDVGLQCGGWTVGWQGGTGPTTSGSTLLEGLKSIFGTAVRYSASGEFSDHGRADWAVAVVAEDPYAEGPGDSAELRPRDQDVAAFHAARRHAKRIVLVVYSGRPLVIPDLIERSDAVVAAWLPGSEASVLADVLAGRYEFEGQLPHPWPSALP